MSERTAQLPLILDACCGSRMFWFVKSDPRALFVDIRAEEWIDQKGRTIAVQPDIIASFEKLPFNDQSFSLVVFDPPHTRAGKKGIMAKKYGTLRGPWRGAIKAGFRECFRVLKPAGVLVFKWAEVHYSLAEILKLSPHAPLFGQRSARVTHFVVFMKPADD